MDIHNDLPGHIENLWGAVPIEIELSDEEDEKEKPLDGGDDFEYSWYTGHGSWVHRLTTEDKHLLRYEISHHGEKGNIVASTMLPLAEVDLEYALVVCRMFDDAYDDSLVQFSQAVRAIWHHTEAREEDIKVKSGVAEFNIVYESKKEGLYIARSVPHVINATAISLAIKSILVERESKLSEASDE